MVLTKNKASSQTKLYKIKKQLKGFWQYCTDNEFIPTVETLCLYLDINRSTLHRWEHSEDNLQLCNIIKNVKNRIFHTQKQLALRGKLNATVFIFNAKNNFGYVDKIDHEHNTATQINVTFNIPKVQTTIPTKKQDGTVIEGSCKIIEEK